MSDFTLYLVQQLAIGVQATIVLFFTAALAGNVLALPVALLRMSKHKWLRYPAMAFILAFRGTPLLVQLYLVYFGVGQILAGIPALRYSAFWPLFRSAYGYAFFTLVAEHGGLLRRNLARRDRRRSQGTDRGRALARTFTDADIS